MTEGSPVGTIVGQRLTAADEDIGQSRTYSIMKQDPPTPNGGGPAFRIVGRPVSSCCGVVNLVELHGIKLQQSCDLV